MRVRASDERSSACVSMKRPTTIIVATSNQMRLLCTLSLWIIQLRILIVATFSASTCATIYVSFRLRSVYGRGLSQNKSADRHQRLLNFKFDSEAVNGCASISHGEERRRRRRLLTAFRTLCAASSFPQSKLHWSVEKGCDGLCCLQTISSIKSFSFVYVSVFIWSSLELLKAWAFSVLSD